LLAILYLVLGLDNWTRVNDRREVVLRAKISRKRRIEIFISALGSREKDIFIYSWYIDIQFSSKHVQALFSFFLPSFPSHRLFTRYRDSLNFNRVSIGTLRLVPSPRKYSSSLLRGRLENFIPRRSALQRSKLFDRKLFNNA
jgi:hypothetical protein